MTTLISNNRASFVVSMQNKDFVVNPPSTSPNFPLKFTALEPNSTISFVENKTMPFDVSLETSIDGFNWTSYTVGDVKTLPNANDSIYFRAGLAGNKRFAGFTIGRNGTVTNNAFYHFEMTGSIEATGNILSLLNRDQSKAKMEEIPGVVASQTSGSFTFFGLFYNCTALTTAPLLPSKNLTTHCYDCMFRGCTSLREMPALPAQHINTGCYMHMFNGCNSFTHTKKIFATKAEDAAFYSMFQDCIGLEEANILDDCIFEYANSNAFRYMFENCEKLRKGTNLIVNGKVGHATCNTTFGTYGSAQVLPTLSVGLTAVPNIHIEELQNKSGLYGALFRGCKLLKSVPADYLKNSASLISNLLCAYNQTDPGVELTDVLNSVNIRDMYGSMFQYCESLSAAPFLYECALSTATYAATNQYNSIFMGCTQLSSLSTDFTKYDANLNNMLKDVAPTGMLYCKNSDAVADLNQHRSELGLPDGWSIEPLPDNFEIP